MGTIEYHTVTGTTTITVADEWSAVIEDLDRADSNDDHRYWRQDRRHARFFSYDAWGPYGRRAQTTSPSAEDMLIAKEERRQSLALSRALRAAVTALPRAQRNLIRDLLAGMSQQEIAKARGVSPAAVSRQKSRALRNLREILTGTQR